MSSQANAQPEASAASKSSYPISRTYPPAVFPPQETLPLYSFSLPCSNFILACTPLLFHPQTGSIVLVYDTRYNHYFLPRGRKDRNESLPACALREGFEESGFRGELVNWGTGTRQPAAPADDGSNMEAFWMQAFPVKSRHMLTYLYLTYYFIGLVVGGTEPDADRSRLVGRHEQSYYGKLVKVEEAVEILTRQADIHDEFAKEPPKRDSQTAQENEDTLGPAPGAYFVPYPDRGSDGDTWDAYVSKNELHQQGKVWQEGQTECIDKEEARHLFCGPEKRGELVAVPRNGKDNSRVQARIILHAWAKLQAELGAGARGEGVRHRG